MISHSFEVYGILIRYNLPEHVGAVPDMYPSDWQILVKLPLDRVYPGMQLYTTESSYCNGLCPDVVYMAFSTFAGFPQLTVIMEYILIHSILIISV